LGNRDGSIAGGEGIKRKEEFGNLRPITNLSRGLKKQQRGLAGRKAGAGQVYERRNLIGRREGGTKKGRNRIYSPTVKKESTNRKVPLDHGGPLDDNVAYQ